jgi:DNA invertase Pin-like site-specific DNA recombinase
MKNLEKRKSDLENIYNKMEELGLTNEFENVKKFKEIFEDYILTGQSYSGKLKIKEINYMIIYKLTTKDNIENEVIIRKIS